MKYDNEETFTIYLMIFKLLLEYELKAHVCVCMRMQMPLMKCCAMFTPINQPTTIFKENICAYLEPEP